MQGSLMMDIAGTWLTAEDRQMLRQPEVGGLIIFARNIESPRQVRELCQAVISLGHALELEVTAEGVEDAADAAADSAEAALLLLEDDAGMQSFLATLLASQGYLPDICASGQQGLQLLAGQAPQVHGSEDLAPSQAQLTDVQQLQKAIAAGADPTQTGEATAAGPGAGGAGGADICTGNGEGGATG